MSNNGWKTLWHCLCENWMEKTQKNEGKIGILLNAEWAKMRNYVIIKNCFLSFTIFFFGFSSCSVAKEEKWMTRAKD